MKNKIKVAVITGNAFRNFADASKEVKKRVADCDYVVVDFHDVYNKDFSEVSEEKKNEIKRYMSYDSNPLTDKLTEDYIEYLWDTVEV